jgi:ubiquitin-conjugating enzyme E2 variant
LEFGEPRPRWLSFLDRASIAACAFVWGTVVLRLAPIYLAWESSLALIGGLVFGYLLADLLSGLVHWLADRYFDPETPVLGPALIAPFREHHEDALAMTRHDFFEISGNNSLATIPLALGLLLVPHPASFTARLLVASVFGLGLSIIATNQFHCWAHSAHPPALARRLQRLGLILSPERHAVHHARAHDRAYCVTSGWLNPLLDRLDLFGKLERGIERLGGQPGRVP